MIYGYVRVSTDRQSTENQRFEITNFAKENGLRIEQWVDETISGTIQASSRLLGQLLKQLSYGDILIISELSRLGRNLMEIMSILHQCMEQQVLVLTVKERYELGNNINSKILAFAFSLSAEIERSLISQRTREALARKKEAGNPIGRPKGRKNNQLKLVRNEEEIRQMIDKNYSMNEIAEKMGVSRQTLRDFLKEVFPNWRKVRYFKQSFEE
ncbi:MAG: master DNA invertase Mpi family serine-type recombinase [Parabacteroides distasonis]|nr:master DNA invertase Mpi family serine-type recombinase [Parabacteroides distasonis]MBQ4161369.1 master DNA invertase Mpi family serine-type recombinase [Parabacteroides sp.]MBR2496889.1 master DNA invertase Mpi family serine-type recombinase [Parabacteroides sp.]